GASDRRKAPRAGGTAAARPRAQTSTATALRARPGARRASGSRGAACPWRARARAGARRSCAGPGRSGARAPPTAATSRSAAEVPERPAPRLRQVARRQPSGSVVLDVVEVDRPQRPVDADPGQERDPAIVLIGLNGLVSILVGLDLVAVALAIRGHRRDLGSV